MTTLDVQPSSAGDVDARGEPIRQLLLALIFLGAAGLVAELLLLEHTENVYQWMPLVMLALVLVFSLLLGFRPSPRVLRLFRGLMVLVILVGLVGIYLHYDGNREFELEMDPQASGFDLLWKVLHGATPTLAPGAMVQLGLLGLVFAYRHPLLRLRA
ncbi:MAG TPA: hypothetical protein VF167_09035 [Longimicrobiaceae bacterium]